MSTLPKLTILPGLLVCLFSCDIFAQSDDVVSLTSHAHVCNTESEAARLADNPQLREMARALVEFKATKYCFIMPHAADVKLLHKGAGYIKFDYKSQVLYTFSNYVIDKALTANSN